MNRIKSIVTAMAITIMFLTTGLLILNPDDGKADAMQASQTDEAGYTWVDSRSPAPQLAYNFTDISQTGTKLSFSNGYRSSYRETVRRYAHTSVALPFTFSYYGIDHTSVHVTTSGKIGFDNAVSSRYFYYWTYYYDIPNNYLPPNTIFVWSTSGLAMPEGSTASTGGRYAGAGIYTQSGVDTDGTKYMIIQWHRAVTYYYYVYRYGYSGYDLDFEVKLFEDGRIECHYKDVTTNYYYYSNGRYCLMGMSNPDNTGGLQYYRGSYSPSRLISDRTAVMYKQYRTELTNITMIPGYGIDQDIYPAQGGQGDFMYWAEANIWIETDVEDFTTLDMTIGPGPDEENIVLRYDFQTEEFQKLNDGNRMMVLDTGQSYAQVDASDPTHAMKVAFYFDFNFNWWRNDLVTVEFSIYGDGVRPSHQTIQDAFRVETRMMMEGNLTILDAKNRELSKGDWVKGGDYITFTGLERKYADPAIPIAPPDSISIAIRDRSGKLTSGDTPDLTDVKVYVNPYYQDMEYSLVFVNVTERNDMSDPFFKGFRFVVQIDSDNPGLPGDLLIRPDSKDDLPQDFDDDRDVYLSWKDAVDQSSGVAMYHISVNMDKDEAYATGAEIINIPKGTYTAPVEGLPEGINKIYVWAEDAVGNEGNSIFIDVKIDLSPVYFSDFYPVTGTWINTLRPRCSIMIHDDLTGVNPITIEYEISTSGEVGLVGDWQTITDAYAPGPDLRVVVSGWFKNGKDNWIRFRARDIAGNPFMESDAYNVWVDAKSPTFKLLSHSEDEYQLNPVQEVRVQVIDEQSWVDSSSIEYRITTQGLTKWSPWLPYKDATDGPKPVVSIREHFRRGADNYIQIRAKDLAGNPVSTSKPFNIRINTYPVIVVISPSSGDRLVEKKEIIFDAGDSYDPDGDRLTISWYRSTPTGQQSLGDSQRVSAILEPGEYAITVIAKDRVNNEVQKTFTITVEALPPLEKKRTEDTDLDGMFDWWEIQYQTKVLVKDAQEDPDGDGFTNKQEHDNYTNPHNKLSHPPIAPSVKEEKSLGPFSADAWPIWALLGILMLVVILTMFITKSKKDRQVNRIKAVRNMRRIMPSVSWDQITTTAYLAPMTGGMALPAQAGPALPSGAAEVPADQALPPAPEQETAAHEAAHEMQQAEGTPPAPEPAPAPMPTPTPAPAPEPMQAAPAGTVPQPETPPAQNNLPPQ